MIESHVVFTRGTVFKHGRWLNEDRTPAICRVTMIRRGVVYYGFGADAKKGRYYATPDYLLAHGAEITCSCGMWPIDEYGAVCPSCTRVSSENACP